jgi:hypothetical protein
MVAAQTRQTTDVAHDITCRRSGRSRTHHVCTRCRARRSLFRYRGAVRADRDHTLCFQCYRALHNSMRALRLAHDLHQSNVVRAFSLPRMGVANGPTFRE